MKIEERKVFIEDKKHINQVHNYSKKRGGDVVMKEKTGTGEKKDGQKEGIEGLKRERNEEKKGERRKESRMKNGWTELWKEERNEGIKDEEKIQRRSEGWKKERKEERKER